LFKSQEYQQWETELVVIETANIVKPLDAHFLKSPETPAHRGLNGSAREKSLAPETVDYLPKGGLRLNGPHGYIY
jgi:Flp pilus assembly secretin CpaC